MQLHDTPSNRIPRSILPPLHDEVWKLHLAGLDSSQISVQLAALGCRATRFSVRRLVIQLKRIPAREAHSRQLAEESKLARASALALRGTYEEALDDVCDDLAIAVRRNRHDQVLSLSRAGRAHLRTIAYYDRLYEAALKQASVLPPERPAIGAESGRAPAPDPDSLVKMPLAPAQTRSSQSTVTIGEKSAHPLEDVGEDFDVTRERIQQIEAKELRHPSRSNPAELRRRHLSQVKMSKTLAFGPEDSRLVNRLGSVLLHVSSPDAVWRASNGKKCDHPRDGASHTWPTH